MALLITSALVAVLALLSSHYAGLTVRLPGCRLHAPAQHDTRALPVTDREMRRYARALIREVERYLTSQAA